MSSSFSPTPATSSESAAVERFMYEAAITPPLEADEEAMLLCRAVDGDASATERIVKAYLRMVLSVARSFASALETDPAGSGMTLSDLVGEGNIGLLKAIRLYDAGRGTKFATYAMTSIRRAIAAAVRVMPSGKSVDAPLHEGTRTTLLDVLINPEGERTTGRIEDEELLKDIRENIGRLSPREQEVIRACYGIGQPQQTYAETGRQMNLTRERVRQIKKTALRNLRRMKAIQQ